MTATAPRPARRFVRSWKERFIKGMPLIFIKRTRLDAERIMEPGTPVSAELRADLGEHRMKLWWMARVVGSPDSEVARKPEPAPKTEGKPKPAGGKGKKD